MSRGKRVTVGPPDAEHALVPVPAGELLDWAAQLLCALTALERAGQATGDLAGHLPDPVTPADLAEALDRTHERIGALLDGHGWWDPR